MADLSLPPEIAAKLARFESQLRTIQFARGAGIVALVAAIGLAVALTADWWWDLGLTARVGLLAGFAIVVGFAVWRCLVRASFGRTEPVVLAAIIEQAHPELRERLSSMIELSDPELGPGERGSELMRSMLARQTVRKASGIEFTDAIETSGPLRWFAVGAIAALLVLAPFSWGAREYGLLWARFLAPWGNFERLGPYEIHVADGDRVAARGSDVLLEATVTPRDEGTPLPESVRIEWTEAEGAAQGRRMEFDEARGAYRTTLPQMLAPIEFRVSADRSRSRAYQITVADRPRITALWLEVEPPSYTGLPASSYDGVLGEVVVPFGSQLTFRLQSDKPIARARLEWLDASGAALTESDERRPIEFSRGKHAFKADLAWTATLDGPFAIRVIDDVGLANHEDPPRRLVLSGDLPPELTLFGSDEVQRVDAGAVVPIRATAVDDISVGALELHYEVRPFGSHETQARHEILTVESALLGGRSLDHEFALDLKSLNLPERTAVTYRVRAADERPDPGPNETWSKTRVLAVNADRPDEIQREVAERQGELKDRLEKLRDDLAHNRQKVDELRVASEVSERQQTAFERNAELAPLAREQEQVVQRLQQVAAELEEHPLFDGLAEPTRAIAREELPAGYEQTTRAAAAQPAEKPQHLGEAVSQLNAAEQKLSQVVEEFAALAALENDLLALNRLAREAERLANRAEEVAQLKRAVPSDANENEEDKAAHAEQVAAANRDLSNDHAELSEQLDDLLERRPELAEAARQQNFARLDEMAEQLEDLAQPQERLAEGLAGEEDKSAQPDANDSKESPAAQAQARQQQLAREAAEQALQAAAERGGDSEAAQQAAEFARQATETAREALAGRLAEAGTRGRQAAEAGQQAAEALADASDESGDPAPSDDAGKAEPGADQESEKAKSPKASDPATPQSANGQTPDGQPTDKGENGGAQPAPGANSPRAQQATALAQRQQELSEEFSRQAGSSPARAGARRAGEQQLARAAEFLERGLSQAADDLAQTPLDVPVSSTQADEARQQTESARRSMQQAAQEIQEGQVPAASESATTAARALREAALRAREAASGRDPDASPVPEEAAEQVVSAARQMQRIAEQLQKDGRQQQAAQNPPASPADPNAAPQQAPDANQPSAERQANADGDGSTPSGESMQDVAQQMRDAAESLAQAAERMQPGRQGRGRRAGNKTAQNETQPGAQQPPDDSAGGDGIGTQVTVDLRRLESELQQLRARDWGRLPRNLETEILQGVRRSRPDEYARLIKLYFQQIAETQKTPEK